MKLLERLGSGLLIVLFLVVTLLPIVWCFVISISPESEMLKATASFLPESPTLQNYVSLLSGTGPFQDKLITGMTNTLKAVLLTEAFTLPICIMSAYALANISFRGRTTMTMALLITTVIPVFATIITIYKIYSQYELLNNYIALTLVYVTAYSPVIIWMLLNHFRDFPKEIEEAAQIDGCSRMQSFFRIVLPNSTPILLAAALILFLNTWGAYQIPLILASGRATKPLTMVMQEFSTKDNIYYGMIGAAGILALIPPGLTAIFFRKYLVSGLTGGAVKG